MSQLTANLRTYGPILTIAGVVALAAALVSLRFDLGLGGWMHGWMGGVLVVFSLLKLFDLRAFAADFAKYDLVAGAFRPYGRVYPFIELGLGLAFLTMFAPFWTYALTILVFGVGLVGVLKALGEGRDLQCACVGRTLNLPLSKVAVFENSSMVVMAALMLGGLLLG